MYHIGDIICFGDICACLPVCNVEIGRDYIKEYIMKRAGGVYLEYHDRPHFHMPRDRHAGGDGCRKRLRDCPGRCQPLRRTLSGHNGSCCHEDRAQPKLQ